MAIALERLDVFASADIDWMEWAQEHNLVKHHYPFTLTASAKGDGPARFLAFLRTEAARTAFASQGFTVQSPQRITQ
jgi:ABC-type molybdate transport system substrate-binding protein